MKNIHVLPTENYKQDYTGEVVKVVRLGQLVKHNQTNEFLINKSSQWAASCDTDVQVPHHIYITSDEEIKLFDCVLATNSNKVTKCEMIPLPFPWKKIILTTDQDLINEGVQPIDDEFLEWFVKNPSCEEVPVANGWGLEIDIETPYYKIIIPKEEQTTEEQLPTKWFKTEEIETWIGESITDDKPIEEIQGGRGKLIVLHQCGENKEELISQLETMIYGLKNGFESFAQ